MDGHSYSILLSPDEGSPMRTSHRSQPLQHDPNQNKKLARGKACIFFGWTVCHRGAPETWLSFALSSTGFHGARTITGTRAPHACVEKIPNAFFFSDRVPREKKFSDEQGRIPHTGVSSSFRGVETISKLRCHRTFRPHEMQVLRC